MSGLPRAMTPHRMLVERYAGSDAVGPIYGPAVEVRCYVEDKVRSVRADDGRTVVSSTVIRCPLDRTLRPEARITVFGQVREVVAVQHLQFPGTPSHTEVSLQ